MLRVISLWMRRRREQKMYHKTTRLFEAWRKDIDSLPEKPLISEKRLALIRLDDIGDFVLWHNFISVYKSSFVFKDYHITLVGNIVWKSLFEQFDPNTVHNTIWVDKHQYFNSNSYRKDLWITLRLAAFDIVVCPSRTRPILLDDACMLATGALVRIGSYNTLNMQKINDISDRLYTHLYAKCLRGHEFFFNRTFTSFVCNAKSDIDFPFFVWKQKIDVLHKQIVCFIGASAKSKTWPVAHWIQLVKLIQQTAYNPILLAGKNELSLAEQIIAATNVSSFVGQTDLPQTVTLIAQSRAVITGDSMAAHVAVACQKPCVILANGVNAKRFVSYAEAGFHFVSTQYTRQYIAAQKTEHYSAVSKDMQSILPTQVWLSMQKLLG